MKLQFDHNIKVAGIGMVPWTRLGPERWLPQYKILSLYDWDLQSPQHPEVLALNTIAPDVHLDKMNSQRLVDEPAFQQVIQDRLQGYALLTYKPVIVPPALANISFLSAKKSHDLAEKFENKVFFRRTMQPLGVPFPDFKIWNARDLQSANIADVMVDDEMILQDEILSGGRGTFRIHDKASLDFALGSIERLRGLDEVVISRHIPNARERSLQCCVTRHGIFVGPLQKQIVGDETLANMAVVDGDRYCGAEVGFEDQYADAYEEMKKYALMIGEKARSLGYRGIYGVDFLLNDKGVYVLEMNPRITGVTPLLTALYREDQDIPFYLLHMLELMDIPYEITDPTINPVPAKGSLLVAHTHHMHHGTLKQTVRSGLYDPKTVEFQREAKALDWQDDTSQLLLQQYFPTGATVKPGGRIAVAYANTPVLGADDTLLPVVQSQVARINDMTVIE